GRDLIAHVVRIHGSHQRHIASRIEASNQLLSMTPEVVFHIELAASATLFAPEALFKLQYRAVGDHRDRTGGGESLLRAAAGGIAPFLPGRIGFDGYPLRRVPSDCLRGRASGSSKDYKLVDNHRAEQSPVQRDHAAKRSSGRERDAIDAEVLNQRDVCAC